MPQGDRTGPAGIGSMTGRGLGYCAGFSAPGFTNSGFARGMGRGFGRGRGFAWRARVFQPQIMPIQQSQGITEKQEKELLQSDLANLKQEMKDIEGRLKELEE